MKLIADLKALLEDEGKRFELIKKELLEVKDKFGDARRTEITYLEEEVSIKDLIKEEDVVITISNLGYIKRTSATEFRQQRRGGRGATASKTRESDFIEHIFVASTHDTMLIFTEKGRCYWLNIYQSGNRCKRPEG
jgi:DNA gyrase subunit A